MIKYMLNVLENMLFDTNIKNNYNCCVNENSHDNKTLINENNALKIQIHLLNIEL
jgi:hypothetical protein